MVILICGPQASGKTHLANQINYSGKVLILEEVPRIDDSNDPGVAELIELLKSREAIALDTAITFQAGTTIPNWIGEKFKTKLIAIARNDQ